MMAKTPQYACVVFVSRMHTTSTGAWGGYLKLYNVVFVVWSNKSLSAAQNANQDARIPLIYRRVSCWSVVLLLQSSSAPQKQFKNTFESNQPVAYILSSPQVNYRTAYIPIGISITIYFSGIILFFLSNTRAIFRWFSRFAGMSQWNRYATFSSLFAIESSWFEMFRFKREL